MLKTGSKLLLDEFPLMILPQLATKIGLNEAIVLQQVNYWLVQCGKERDGRSWIFNTYPDWEKQFPFFSLSTIRRTIKKLEDMNLLITGNYNKLKIDQTKWYTIDFDILNSRYVQNEQACNSSILKNGQANSSNCNSHLSKLNRPIPETTPEINKKINKNKASSQATDGTLFVDNFSEDAKDVYQYFIDSYIKSERKVHPSINEKVVDKLNDLLDHGEIYDPDRDLYLTVDEEGLYLMIDEYFRTTYPLSEGGYADHRIFHFLSDMILKNLYYHSGLM